MSNWYVCRINPTCEDRAAVSLSRAGFGVYAPAFKLERFNRRKSVFVTRTLQLMPGYLFIDWPDVPADECWTGRPTWFRLRSCDGVKAVLGTYNPDGELVPYPVPGRLVERIMAAQLDQQFDDTRAAKIHRQEMGKTARETAAMKYPIGTIVTVEAGPLAGLSGEVESVTSRGALELMVSVFGRMSPVEVPLDQIEAMAA